MADSFDPYHVWLGISLANQPPNHYRLLGIELFEPNGDVIDAAASRQSMMLRDLTSGEHAKLAGKLLDEVKAARVTLLNVEEKSHYDAKLYRELRGSGAQLSDTDMQNQSDQASPGYHLWLGITPELQPPTHYRLLGLESFEASEEVIQAAADRQSRYLREVAVGKQRKQSQRLLNEVAAARRCLLDPEKRSAYDKQLRLKTDKRGESEEQPGSSKTSAVQAGHAVVQTEKVSETSDPSAQQKSNDASQTDMVPPGTGKADQSAEDSAVSPLTGGTSFPSLLEPEAQASPLDEDASPDSTDAARRKMVIIVGSITSTVLLAGAGLILWLSGSEVSASRETAAVSDEAGLKDSREDHAEAAPSVEVQADDNHAQEEPGDQSSVAASPSAADKASPFEQLLEASKLASNPANPPEETPTKPEAGKPAPKPGNNRAAAMRAARRKAAAAKAAAARKAAAMPKPPPLRKAQLPQLAGTVSSQYWKNVTAEFSELVKSPPSARPSTRSLKSLAAGANERLGPNVFQRVRGVLIPPVDGGYQFHVKIAGQGKFLLGEGLRPFPGKQVKDGQIVQLSGSQNYYFELLHLDKEGNGGFNVGWTFPNGAKEAPIPGGRAAWTPFLINFAAIHRTKLECSGNLSVEPVKESDLILVSGNPRGESTVTLEFQSDITTWSAFQLSAVRNAELLPNGPGLGPRGMFSLGELTLEYQEPGSTEFVRVPLKAPVARAGVSDRLVDGDTSTKWIVRQTEFDSVAVILVPEERLDVLPQTKLRVTIHQDDPLGLFRFRGTASNAAGKISALRKQIDKDNAPFALHVNLGGGNWKDSDNRTWVKSKAYATGSWGHVGGQPVITVASESAPRVLKSALSGITAFRADVPDGRYDVSLFFRAHGVRKAGDRVFSIQVESLPAVPLDLFVATGGGTRTFTASTDVVVKDGRLDIVFRKIAGPPPILNALSISE